jgi:hypothetical protein
MIPSTYPTTTWQAPSFNAPVMNGEYSPRVIAYAFQISKAHNKRRQDCRHKCESIKRSNLCCQIVSGNNGEDISGKLCG